MKKLITLLAIVLAIQCAAQESADLDFNSTRTGVIDIYLSDSAMIEKLTIIPTESISTWEYEWTPNITHTSEGKEIKDRFILLSDFEKYTEHCYNDSAARYYYLMCDWDCWEIPCEKDSIISILGIKCPENWEHKKPTFEGFYNWLKEKGNTK